LICFKNKSKTTFVLSKWKRNIFNILESIINQQIEWLNKRIINKVIQYSYTENKF